MHNEIKKYRKLAKLNQAELGQRMDPPLAQGTIANYESGRRAPGLNEARQIVDVFNSEGVSCTLDEVFPFDDDQEVKKSA